MHFRLLLAIGLCSAASLAFEVNLMRVFSVTLWYHFAYMIISIAMLGIGASGTVLSLFPGVKDLGRLGLYSLLFGLSVALSYVVSNLIPFDPVALAWSKTQILSIGLYYIVLSFPFFFFGLMIATALSSLSAKSGLIYGADLTGAGLGSVVILVLLNVLAPERAVFLLSLAGFLAAIIVSSKGTRIAASICACAAVFILFTGPDFIAPRISPYKGLQAALRFPGAEHLKTYHSPFSRVDIFRSPSVRFAPGLSLRHLDELPGQTGLAVDGGDVNAVTDARGGTSLAFLRRLPSALPYELGKGDDVLVIDPKGGLQALVAVLYGCRRIDKVETDPLIVGIIQGDLSEYSGDIYGDRTWSGLGRSWLRGRSDTFDIVDISLMGANPGGTFGIAEDYRFTVEAFREYLLHLKRDGILGISLYLIPPPRIELRLVSSLIESMEGLGIGDPSRHIAVIRSWGTISILAKRTPFSDEDISRIRRFCADRRFDIVHYHGIGEEETNRYVRSAGNEYYRVFRDLLGAGTRSVFTEQYLFDISPVHDDRPFFHHYLRIKNMGRIYALMGEKWNYFIEEGYILPALFLQVLVISIVIILLPLLRRKATPATPRPGSWFLLYFAFLGTGFMFVEIPLIQKTILPLDYPPYAVAVVLSAVLIGSGAGSVMSHRVPALGRPSSVIVTAILAAAYGVLLPHITDATGSISLSVKIPLTFIMFLPLGFFMGIPFPLGIKILGAAREQDLPWAWAINGCVSVLAPLLTIMLAMAAGFTLVLWAGAVCYLCAFCLLLLFRRKSYAEISR